MAAEVGVPLLVAAHLTGSLRRAGLESGGPCPASIVAGLRGDVRDVANLVAVRCLALRLGEVGKHGVLPLN